MQRVIQIFLFGLCFLIFEITYADYRVIPVTHGGSLHGLAKFSSETPPRFMFTNRQEANCPHGIPQQNLIVKQENRGIKNVLIVLEIRQGKTATLRSSELVNKGCVFEPHLQWSTKSSSLLIKNSDTVSHNVHAYLQDVTVFNVDIDPGSPPTRRPLLQTGLYKINCDRHLWMRSWLFVSEHPYVAVTDAQGQFVIQDIPPGTYDLRAWHEGWEEKGTETTGQIRFQQRQQVLQVNIRAEETTEVLFNNLEPTFF